jgi:hypothetical protein
MYELIRRLHIEVAALSELADQKPNASAEVL